MTRDEPSTRKLAEAISAAMPALNETEQRMAVTLYRTLAEGRPVGHAEIAHRMGVNDALVRDALAGWPGVFLDDEERVIGFWGLALREMPHRFAVEGVELYTWCAWDPLFIGPLLGKPARVTSQDPLTGAPVSMTVTPQGVENVSPPGAVVSFLAPDKPWDHDIIQGFCHFVLFFAGRESGERWAASHPGTFLLSAAEAFEVGRHTNAVQFREAAGLLDRGVS